MSDEFTDEEKAGFYKAVYSRRDVRSHFTQESIDEKTLTKILHAAFFVKGENRGRSV